MTISSAKGKPLSLDTDGWLAKLEGVNNPADRSQSYHTIQALLPGAKSLRTDRGESNVAESRLRPKNCQVQQL